MGNNKLINVLHVYKTSRPASYGGVESFIDTLCKTGSKLGVKNTVLTLHPSPAKNPLEMDGYAVHQAKQDLFAASTGFSLSAFSQFKKLAGVSDIIHYHFPNPFADMLHMVYPPKKPCVVTYHSDIIKQKYLLHLYRPLMRRFLNSINHIISTSPNYFASSVILQQYADKVSVIPVGVDHGSYETADPERFNYWRTRLPEPFFLFVGAMRYYKGLHIALEAISGTKIRVVIAGVNGIEEKLKAKAASLHLDNVDFLGFVNDEDKVALLHLCYGFIFPSHLRSEAFGLSLLEAAAVGNPMISCEIGTGTTFVNAANETGLVIKPGSSGDLREAMQYLLDNPDAAAKMGENAKKRSRELFTAERQAKLYFEIYQSLVNKGTT
ncbi:glycosyltransferase [Yersinia alsatica]|uniref:glycosyltransferase n=1 Tax=Yersinia alsatica TaxID=2890317 RepID=UPI001643C9F3|nr:glycosyltransferase [Yersinia alsatica]